MQEKVVKIQQDDSVTRWLTSLRHGDDSAATRLWTFLNRRLTRLSKSVVGKNSAAYDEDDVAQSAFIALCSAIEDGKYELLANRHDLWKLLATITLNKARNRAARESAQRRGGDRVKLSLAADEGYEIPSSGFSGEEQFIMCEECERLLDLLKRDEVKQVAILKVEGNTDEEVAERLGCTRRSVQRRLSLIREVWSREIQ